MDFYLTAKLEIHITCDAENSLKRKGRRSILMGQVYKREIWCLLLQKSWTNSLKRLDLKNVYVLKNISDFICDCD